MAFASFERWVNVETLNRMRRSLKGLVKTLVAAEVGYVLLSFLFLNSGLLPWLVNDHHGDSLQIGYDFAYSWFPGFARANHLTIRVNDDDVQLFFHLHSVDVAIRLGKLFERELVASRVAVDGLDFRLRLRREPGELKSPIIPYLAPIPGLLPLRTPKGPEAPNPHPWKVRLAEVRIDNLEEVWVEEYRYQGRATVTGDLFLHPGHNTKVSRAVLTAATGRVTLGDSEVAAGIHTEIQATLGPYEKTKFRKSNEIFDFLSATVDGSAQVTGLGFLNHYLRGVQNVALAGGVGPLATHLVLQNGRLVGPSRLKIQADDLRASLWDQRAHGNAVIDWHIEELRRRPRGRLSVLFPHFIVQHLSDTSGLIEGRDLTLLAMTPDLGLKHPFEHLDIEVRTPEARISDLSYFESYFPRGSRVRLHGGEGTLDAAVFASSLPNHQDTGFLHLRTEGVHLDLKGAELQGDIVVDGVLHQGDLKTGRLDISGTQVYLRRVAAATYFHQRPEGYRDWWGEIDVRQGILQLKKNRHFQADIRIRGRDARPILGISTQDAIPGVLGGVLAFDNLRASLSLLVNDEVLSLSDGVAQGGGVTVRGWLRASGDDRLGKVLVEYGPVAAGLAIQGPTLEIKLNDAYQWYGEPIPAE